MKDTTSDDIEMQYLLFIVCTLYTYFRNSIPFRTRSIYDIENMPMMFSEFMKICIYFRSFQNIHEVNCFAS